MRRRLTAALSTAVIAAALGLPGCSSDEDGAAPQTAAPSPTASPTGAATPSVDPLPAPAALADVVTRLGDAAIPGAQKLNLVEGAAPDSAGVFDQFATALINGGFTPLKVDVRDVRWSDRDPADVMANVDITSTRARGPHFGFPMEFKLYQGNWQLSARTADVLLAFRTDTAGPSPTPGH